MWRHPIPVTPSLLVTPIYRGDLERWRGYFRRGAGYVQGDSAIRHVDGSFSFHGRCSYAE